MYRNVNNTIRTNPLGRESIILEQKNDRNREEPRNRRARHGNATRLDSNYCFLWCQHEDGTISQITSLPTRRVERSRETRPTSRSRHHHRHQHQHQHRASCVSSTSRGYFESFEEKQSNNERRTREMQSIRNGNVYEKRLIFIITRKNNNNNKTAGGGGGGGDGCWL